MEQKETEKAYRDGMRAFVRRDDESALKSFLEAAKGRGKCACDAIYAIEYLCGDGPRGAAFSTPEWRVLEAITADRALLARTPGGSRVRNGWDYDNDVFAFRRDGWRHEGVSAGYWNRPNLLFKVTGLRVRWGAFPGAETETSEEVRPDTLRRVFRICVESARDDMGGAAC